MISNMEGPPDTKFDTTKKAYADRIASERIARAGTHQLSRELADLLRDLGDEVDPADVRED